ncbi:hypothetical protein BT93_E1855 [Corymbia citriodora subsp. variegata]|nr:hypothetical protein BT93_E1855 [Corymbia citriodora subsp. variegata]
MTTCSYPSCKYRSPEATPFTTRNLCSQTRVTSGSSNRYLSRLPLAMYSYTSRRSPLFRHQPRSWTRFRWRSRPMLEISDTNSRRPCFDSCEIRFTAIGILELGKVPRYTLPNPPCPRSSFSLNPWVACLSSW